MLALLIEDQHLLTVAAELRAMTMRQVGLNTERDLSFEGGTKARA